MKLNNEPVRNWFGFTRRERRSTSILLVIIILVIVLRYVLPDHNIGIEYYSIMTGDNGIINEVIDSDSSTGNSLFDFDPNTASYDTLLKLGFAAKEANLLIRYRSSGGKFRKPADIGKIYGVDSLMVKNMEHHVILPSATTREDRSPPPAQEKRVIELNSCDSISLVALPGIGPVLSARILKYRNLLGGFASVEQLKEVYGLPEETFDMIKGRLFADTVALRKININSAGFKELSSIHYLEKYEVSAILKYRELAGSIRSIEDLKESKILTPEKADKIEPYLDFR